MTGIVIAVVTTPRGARLAIVALDATSARTLADRGSKHGKTSNSGSHTTTVQTRCAETLHR